MICFDRAARVLFGCSADEFFDFVKLHPFAGNPFFTFAKFSIWRLWLHWNSEILAGGGKRIDNRENRIDLSPLFGIREIFYLAATFGRNP